MAENDFKKAILRDRGPGPGAYMLPPLVGFPKHGLTKRRYPAYTMGSRLRGKVGTVGAGPAYFIDRNLTRFGKNGIPSYSMGIVLHSLKGAPNPGPAAYLPDYNLAHQRAPQYSLGQRSQMGKAMVTPAPNAYRVPTTIGCKTVDKEALPCYTMGTAAKYQKGFSSPGPAAYSVPKLNAYKERLPLYSMGAKSSLRRNQPNPGPAAYLPKGLGRGPAFYFGIKHSEFSPPLILEEDN